MIAKCNNTYISKLSEKGNHLITFFTPTFNRAPFLSRIEDFLVNQTCKNFVWIIVNDGSKDNTDEVVKEILRRELLPVKFISKPNGGKHSAFKAALEACETTYFQCMDDDDIYLENAVEFFVKKWAEIKSENNDEIGAIRTLSRYPDGTFVTNFQVKIDEEYDASTIETNFVMKRRQENWTCYDTAKLRSVDLFKNYWMDQQQKFLSEGIWQTRFARKYKCRYVHQCYREYRSDDNVSLSRSIKNRQHYVDVFLNEKLVLDEQIDLVLKYNKLSIPKRIMLVNCLRDYLDIKYIDLLRNTQSCFLKFCYILTWIPSLFGKYIIEFAVKYR